ncbi:DNA polymerase I [Patescibacteria group bacterium]|nr:DNA polymerase I [Patescibacteria group bacterium]
MTKQKRIIIIDGNALIHRSFHALPPTLSTKDGTPINAVYGFTSFLLKSITDLDPDYIVLTLDKKGPTFRHKEYKEYKAKRIKAPQELYDQIPLVKKVAKAFNIPIFEMTGYEADDLIGSIVNILNNGSSKTKEHLEKMIITGDMDTLQLVGPYTKVYTMSRGLSDTVIYNKNKVEEKYGLRPNQIIDYKALRGDPSDNIPGVPGIGDKTAVDLLQLFSTLENIYKYLEKHPEAKEIKARTAKLLKENKDKALLSKSLATIKVDVDFKFKLEEAEFNNIEIDKITKLFKDLEFKTLLPRVEKLKKDKNKNYKPENIDKFARNKKELKYKLVNNEEDFQTFLKELKKQKEFTFDTEADSLDVFSATLLGISFSFKEKEAYYININSGAKTFNLFNSQENNNKWLEELKPIFNNEKVGKIGHNVKFDLRLMKAQGVKVKGLNFDTKIAAYLINPGNRQHSLDALSENELDWEKINSEDLVGKGRNKINYGDVDLEKMSLYSCEDADCTNRLIPILKKQLKKYELEKLYYDIELPLIEVLADMEDNGIYLSREKLSKIAKKVNKEINSITKEIYKLANKEFNINSPKQLQEIIFKELDIPTQNIKKTKTGYSTAFDELEKLKHEHPIILHIQEYRELYKLKTTYIDALPELINNKTQRLHTHFNQTITATGRLSSTAPNLQNIPVKHELGKEIRQSFTVKEDYSLVALDYSQIELRLAAEMSQDKTLVKAFKNNQDIHRATAAAINQITEKDVNPKMRQEAKAVNFGILYGQGPHGLSQNADIPYARAKDFIDKYFQIYSGVKQYIEDTIEFAKKESYVVTMFGRRRLIPEINSEIALVRKAAERTAVNTPIQGTASDIIKIAMNEVYNKYKNKDDIKILLQVHDELIFSIKKDKVKIYAKEIKNIMENVCKLSVPLIAEIKTGKSWGDLEKIEL